MKGILIALALACGSMVAKAQAQPAGLIPAPATYSVHAGTEGRCKSSISSKEMAGLREKAFQLKPQAEAVLQLSPKAQAVRISRKALLRHLKGRKLADWQLKSAYLLELGKKGVKIVAADEEGVFYARQTLRMMAALDSSLTCCTILDWPEPSLPGQGLRVEAVGDDGLAEDEPLPLSSGR